MDLKKCYKHFKEWVAYSTHNIKVWFTVHRDRIKRWFEWYPTLKEAVEWDFDSIYAVEEYQLIRLRNCLKHDPHFGNSLAISRMDLALRLLKIIREDDGGAEMVYLEPATENNWLSRKHKWVMNIYVNTRNAYRFNKPLSQAFTSDCDKEMLPLFKDDLRLCKAKYLYHKLMYQYMERWWV